MIDAALRQQLPTGDGQDVAQGVVNLFRTQQFQAINAAILIPDIEARIASGEKKYGTRLKTHNGRNATLDLYQEVLDGINYSYQNILEKAPLGSVAVTPYIVIFNTLLETAIQVKKLLVAQEQEVIAQPIHDLGNASHHVGSCPECTPNACSGHNMAQSALQA